MKFCKRQTNEKNEHNFIYEKILNFRYEKI